MKYYLYTSNDQTTTDPFLTYDGCATQSDAKEPIEITVVLYYIQRLLHGKTMPVFIEQSILTYFNNYGDSVVNSLFGSDTVMDSTMEVLPIHYILEHMNDLDEQMHELFYKWTEDEIYPLVVVGENDMCASFLLHQFPPIERYS